MDVILNCGNRVFQSSHSPITRRFVATYRHRKILTLPANYYGCVNSNPFTDLTGVAMRCSHILSSILASLLLIIGLRAEGLIQNVAEDGAAAVYDFKQKGEIIDSGEALNVSAAGTARLALVGTQTIAGLKSRWIELEIDHEINLGKKQRTQLVYFKVLVPESDLVDQDDPLARSIKIYSMQSPSDKEPRLVAGKEERRLALWSLRSYFPKSPTEKNRLKWLASSQEIKTTAGTFDCKVRAFDSYVDQYLLGASRIQECRIHRIWKNSQSPFGVVAMNVHSESQQVSIPGTPFAGASDRMSRGTVSLVTELRLRNVEENFTSRFPQHK